MIRQHRIRTVITAGLIMVIMASVMSGCYDPKEVQAFLKKNHAPISGVEYRLLPPDIIRITSIRIPEINGVDQQIRPDGKINLPLIGEIEVAGKTPKEVESEITALAGKYYADVDANVQVISFKSQKFFVFGQVARPGPRAWTGHDSLLDALADAQPNDLAWTERIVVVRGSAPMEGGQAPNPQNWKYKTNGIHPDEKVNGVKKMTVNLWAMVKSGDMANNVLLQPNDVIYVQPNPFAKVGLAVQNLLLPIRPAAQTVSEPAGAVGAVGG